MRGTRNRMWGSWITGDIYSQSIDRKKVSEDLDQTNV